MYHLNLNSEIFFRDLTIDSAANYVGADSGKVELLFHIDASKFLSVREKAILKKKLKNRISVKGFLYIVSQGFNSVVANKEKALNLFYNLLAQSLGTDHYRPSSFDDLLLDTKTFESETPSLKGTAFQKMSA